VRFVVLGVVIGLATLTRAEGILLGIVIVVPLGLLLRGVPRKGRFQRVGLALGLAVAVIAPWTIRNAIQFHAFVPVSNNVATLVDGANCDATYGGSQIGLWIGRFPTAGGEAAPLPQAQACFDGFDVTAPHFDEVAVANTHTREGLSYARHHLRRLPQVATARVLRTWGLYSPGQQIDFESLEGRPRAWEWRGTIMYWVLLPFAVVGVAVLHKRRRLLWPLLAPALTVTIVAAMTYGLQRFRIAAEPAILVAAAVTFDALARRLRRVSVPTVGTVTHRPGA